MPSAVHVANQLSELSLVDLTELLLARPTQLGRQRDLHDVADALLATDSITATLRSLSRRSLTSLADGHADADAVGLALADRDGKPYPEVRALLPAIGDEPIPTEPATAPTDASTMLHTVGALRDLLAWIAEEPLPMSATGGVLKAEEKTLALGLVIPESESHIVVWIAERTGFARTVDRRLRITAAGKAALDNLDELWSVAVDSVLTELPRTVLSQIRDARRLDRAFCEWVWPMRDTAGKRTLDSVLRAVDMLGLVAGATTDCGRAVLSADDTALRAIRATVFPALLDSVYVLDDLSVIAPGPISTTTATALDSVSVIETRGLASKRRLDPARILRSITEGSTVESLLETLGAHSLTPLTSAVVSTVTDIATNTRFVSLNGTGTDTAAKASHPELGALLLVDPRLQRLAPVGVDAVTVLYGASRDRVETALIEGRYTVVSAERPVPVADPTPPSPLIDLAEDLHRVGLGSTHLERALLMAGKARARVTLVVDTATGPRTITLEPRHVANGRVRGLDTGSDVERTLPISAILELKAVGE
ncbi:MAG: helicase-associated domain-containing protein [Microbacteriaceae bacterium]